MPADAIDLDIQSKRGSQDEGRHPKDVFRSVFPKDGLQCVSGELVKSCRSHAFKVFLPKGITEVSFRRDIRKEFLRE